MIEDRLFQSSLLKHVGGVALSVLVGFLGGVACGAVILSLCTLAGRSGTTGAEYVGYGDLGVALVGAMYGGPLGAILGPLGYVSVVRVIGFRSATPPAAIGTVAVGFACSLFVPGLGMVGGTVGFFVGLLFARFAPWANRSKWNRW